MPKSVFSAVHRSHDRPVENPIWSTRFSPPGRTLSSSSVTYRAFVSSRLVQANRDPTLDADVSLLSLRVGTKFGVVSHTFRVETKLDLIYWTKAISQCLQSAVVRSKEVVFRTWSYLFIDKTNSHSHMFFCFQHVNGIIEHANYSYTTNTALLSTVILLIRWRTVDLPRIPAMFVSFGNNRSRSFVRPPTTTNTY